MPKTLSTTAESQLDRKDIRKKYRLTIGGTNVTPYVMSYGLAYDTNFGIASMSCSLINNNGIFSDGGSSEINIEDEVVLTEYFANTTDSFGASFTGYVRQRRKVKSGGSNTIALTCLDFLVKLEDTDIEQKFEATKVAVSSETLTPNYLTTGNDNLAQVFDFANDSIALEPPPTISILDNYSAIKYTQDSGYQISHEEGQVVFGSAFNARTEYDAVASYSFYPIGLHIEDIIEDIITTTDGYCYDKDTEILTEDGWKLLKDIVEKKEKIKVATLNLKKDIVEYNYPQKYYKFKYKGKMLHQQGRRIDFMVTPNHNVLCRSVPKRARHWYENNKEIDFEFVKAKNLNKQIEYKKNFPYEGKEKEYFLLPEYYSKNKKNKKFDKRKIKMDVWLKFFGIWLAEGSLKKSYDYNIVEEIEVHQSLGKKQKEIQRWLKPLNFKFRKRKDRKNIGHFFLYDIQMSHYLIKFGHSGDKYIPTELRNLSKRQLKILLDAMMLGDGTYKNNIGILYTTKSKRLADDFQEIALKVGYASNILKHKKSGIYTISLAVRPNSMPNQEKDNKKWINYNNFVYCLKVPNHLMYVRRNGKGCWNGNSNYLFGESSAQDLIDNHLTETYNNMEGTNTDTLTPNLASQTIAIETALTTAVTAGDTSITVTSTSGFPSSGSGEVNGDDFTWTGKTATTLTGIPTTGDNALKAHPVSAHVIYSTSYAGGRVWSHSYNNHITTLTSSDYTVPSGATIDYVDKRQGRIILDTAISILSVVTCNSDYDFKTLQSTGIETPSIDFTYQKTKNRLEAIKTLKELVAPNYVLRTVGTDKIWGSYLTQKSTEDYTLKCITSLDYAEDTDIYTRTKFFGKNENPTNVCWQENLAFLTTGETYTATATDTELTWNRTEGEWQVYSTGLPEGSIITSTFQPRVRINGVQINNQLHQIVMQPVTTESWGMGEVGGRPKYRFKLHFAWTAISPGKDIYCYNATGVLTKTITANHGYMNYEQGVFQSGAVDENDPWRVWLTISTATFWVNWSTELLQIDFGKAEIKVHNKLIPSSQLAQVKVTADYEYKTVIEGIRNGEYIIDGRWDSQAQTVFYTKPASGFIYFKCDLGSTYSVQALDLVAGFYKPDNRENFDNLDNRRKFDMTNTYTLKYSTDNVTYYNVAKEAVRFNLSGGQALSLERDVLGDDFEARYFQLEVNDMSQIMYDEGVWVAAFTEFAVYNNVVLVGESTLIPYTELSVASTLGATTITVDDTTGFSSSGTAYIDEDAFTYTGKTATTFTGCSSVTAHAIDTQVSQSIATTSTVYDVAGLLGRVGDKVYKNMEINEYLSTSTKANKRAKDWLTEYQKDHSKLTAATLYGPHFRVGQTLKIVDNLNRINKRYFIDSIKNSSGGINLGLARYP